MEKCEVKVSFLPVGVKKMIPSENEHWRGKIPWKSFFALETREGMAVQSQPRFLQQQLIIIPAAIDRRRRHRLRKIKGEAPPSPPHRRCGHH
jgi:hypothetical protein